MKNTRGVPLGASGRGRYAGAAAVEDRALPTSTPSAAVQWHGRCDRSRWHRLAHIMLLAQSEKCQGSGDSVPGLCLVSIQKVPKNRMSQNQNLTMFEVSSTETQRHGGQNNANRTNLSLWLRAFV